MPDWVLAIGYGVGMAFWLWVFSRIDKHNARKREERERSMRNITPD